MKTVLFENRPIAKLFENRPIAKLFENRPIANHFSTQRGISIFSNNPKAINNLITPVAPEQVIFDGEDVIFDGEDIVYDK